MARKKPEPIEEDQKIQEEPAPTEEPPTVVDDQTKSEKDEGIGQVIETVKIDPSDNGEATQSPVGSETSPKSPSPPTPPASTPLPLSPADARTWAMLAHLSVLANLVTGFLGPLIALVIYLIFRERSRYVAYQSMQSFVFQMVWWVAAGALAALAWTVSGILTVIVVGICLMPFALLISLIPLAALVYGVIGAIETNQGKDFKYWLIGDWTRSILTGN